jgi:hypothetical protein
MSVTDVVVSREGGSVSVRVTERRHPRGIIAVVWRFGETLEREGMAGEISREIPDVPLGAPRAVNGKGFLLDGFVIPVQSRSSAPYQVVVTVLQGGRDLHAVVPQDHGTGTIGQEEIRFRYSFRICVE